MDRSRFSLQFSNQCDHSVPSLENSKCTEPMNRKCSWVVHLRFPIKSSKMYHNWQILGELSEHCKYMLRKLENLEHFECT